MKKISREKKMEAYVERMHWTQFRQDGTPAWVHVKRVRTILGEALKRSAEGTGLERETLRCAALGHDLLEDTKASREQIAALIGLKALKFIESMTNRLGDAHPRPYVKQVTEASEETRLIKLADLTDNLTQASMNVHGLGLRWMYSYFLPIVDPMRLALTKTVFKRYKKTGTLLTTTAAIAREHLKESIEAAERKAFKTKTGR